MKLELYFAPGACSFVPHVALEAIKASTKHDFDAKSSSCTRASRRHRNIWRSTPTARCRCWWPTAGR
jgi:hypothetical protein